MMDGSIILDHNNNKNGVAVNNSIKEMVKQLHRNCYLLRWALTPDKQLLAFWDFLQQSSSHNNNAITQANSSTVSSSFCMYPSPQTLIFILE